MARANRTCLSVSYSVGEAINPADTLWRDECLRRKDVLFNWLKKNPGRHKILALVKATGLARGTISSLIEKFPNTFKSEMGEGRGLGANYGESRALWIEMDPNLARYEYAQPLVAC